MRNRDYELVKDGKYNMKAIMQRAWVYVRQLVILLNLPCVFLGWTLA